MLTNFLRHWRLERRQIKLKMIAVTVLFLLLLAANIVLAVVWHGQYVHARETRQMAVTVQQLNSSYAVLKQEYRNNIAAYGMQRPPEYVNSIQNDFLAYIEQKNNLSLKSLTRQQEAPTDDTDKAIELVYTMTLEGTWENIIKAVYDFEYEKFNGSRLLINLRDIQLSNAAEQGKIQAECQYVIFFDKRIK